MSDLRGGPVGKQMKKDKNMLCGMRKACGAFLFPPDMGQMDNFFMEISGYIQIRDTFSLLIRYR